MAPTRDVKETIRARVRRDPAVADALLKQSVECLHGGEADVARILLRDYIYAIVGLEQLSRLTGKSPDSLEHILETDNNPEAHDLLEIISLIQQNKDSQTEADNLAHKRVPST